VPKEKNDKEEALKRADELLAQHADSRSQPKHTEFSKNRTILLAFIIFFVLVFGAYLLSVSFL